MTRFSISAKLQLAFGVVAGLTVIAAAVAFLSFETVEQGLQNVTSREVPVTLDAMRLSAISRDISATAARFISARTVADQRAALASIGEKRGDLATVLGRMQQVSGDTAALATLGNLSQRLEANLAALEEAITQRTAIRAQIDSLLDQTHHIYAEIIERLRIRSDRNEALEIASRTHFLVSLISEGSIIKEPAVFKPMQDRLRAAIETLDQSAASLPDDELKTATAKLAGLGLGADSVFAQRARELFTATMVDSTIDENVAILRDLDGSVGSLVRDAEVAMESGTEHLPQASTAAVPGCCSYRSQAFLRPAASAFSMSGGTWRAG